jgi:D-alanine-D-alanine ligase
MSGKLKITVMLGGPGAEREVSLRSGAAVAQALRSRGHEVFELDPREPGWTLPAETDVVFLALHGTYGEDGVVQAELDKLGAIYTGCDAEASRIGFDKVLTKQRCVAAGVPTARFVVVEAAGTPWPRGWNPPVVLKPVRQGSSVGLQFVERVADWSAGLTESLRYGSEVLVEERISGRECTVGILGNEPFAFTLSPSIPSPASALREGEVWRGRGSILPLVEVRPKTGVYDYRSKYSEGTTEYLCPAPFDDAITQRIQQAGFDAFKAIGGRDYARVDVMVKANGDPVVLEVNTLPGMTETSLLPKAAAAAGISYAELCERMVKLALKRGAAVISMR